MNIRIVILVACLVWGAAAACPGGGGCAAAAGSGLISDAEVLSKFAAATAAYKAQNYDKAVEAYEEILRGGRESGALYYNLGNSYFKKGNLGKAVLNYERARRLIPRDGDLDFNLEYARQLVEQRIRNVGPDVALSAQVGQRIRDWTDRELAWALCGLALLLACAHVSSLFGRWPQRSRRGALGSLCVLWLICAGGFAVKIEAETDLAVAVVSGEAKFEPREDATTHFWVTEGARAKVLRVEDAWAKIRRDDGKAGWVPEKIFERF